MEEALEIPVMKDLTMVLGSISQVINYHWVRLSSTIRCIHYCFGGNLCL